MNLNCQSSIDAQNGGDHQLVQIDSSKYNLRDAVKLPSRENPNEWIANNIFDFHKQICMLFGTVSQFCSAQSCPKMTAGKKYQYLWSYGPERQPVEYSAFEYIHLLLAWVQEQLDDESIFPSMSIEKGFPADYIEICKTIAKRLMRVYAHIYHHHLQEVRKLKEEAHMNTSLKHFIYFVSEFELVSNSELDPLKDYIQKFDISTE